MLGAVVTPFEIEIGIMKTIHRVRYSSAKVETTGIFRIRRYDLRGVNCRIGAGIDAVHIPPADIGRLAGCNVAYERCWAHRHRAPIETHTKNSVCAKPVEVVRRVDKAIEADGLHMSLGIRQALI